LERGDPATGVPALRASFPLAVEDGEANYEIACGYIKREADGEECPGLTWADLCGVASFDEDTPVGATLLNDSKYGYQVSDSELRLTLLRSSYDPDPLPELGRHRIRFAIRPRLGAFCANDCVRAGFGFNHPLIAVGTTVHGGVLPPEASLLAVDSESVMLSGLKKAEDSDALILRLYSFDGPDTTARVLISPSLVPEGTPVVETDLLEQPLDGSTARFSDGVLEVDIPAFGIATVRIG